MREEIDWSMRNNTNYSETGVLSALQLTAAFPQIVLENFYKKSRNSVDAGKKDDIHGYMCSPSARTKPAWHSSSIRSTALQGIEVGSRQRAKVKLKEGTFPTPEQLHRQARSALRYGRLAKNPAQKTKISRPPR